MVYKYVDAGELISQIDDACWTKHSCSHRIIRSPLELNEIKNIIDSLAVEVKAGAISEIIDEWEADKKNCYDGYPAVLDPYLKDAESGRAEHATLQAEIDKWKEKAAEEKEKYSEQCQETRKYKDALRTLAIKHVDLLDSLYEVTPGENPCAGCPAWKEDDDYTCKDDAGTGHLKCVQNHVDYALAHPTSEDKERNEADNA